ncbi:MAG TPA: SRPBCC family protein [Thermoanaerobaculia bacterium]|nr:SRPBCC family protein [Thermoanaerobaculia bacterium]
MSTESTTSTDRIEKQVLLRAPRSRVWQALTDSQAFGEWFGVKLTDTFTQGGRVRGAITHPGYEHLPFEITIEQMEPERLFSWRWHPHAIDLGIDYSAEPTTLVVFELAEVAEGTLLTVVESGFDGIPLTRRLEAYRGNEGGWEWQMRSIESYVSRTA